jgi:hypothetical protein
MKRSPKRPAVIILPPRPRPGPCPGLLEAAADPADIVSFDRRHFESRGLVRDGLDLLYEKDGRVYAVVTPEDIASLVSRGVPFTIETARFAPSAGRGLRGRGPQRRLPLRL